MSVAVRTPHCTILGGPNGSGKSSLYERLRLDGTFVNADAVARRINSAAPESAALAAGREVIATLEHHVAARRSFVYETTLSSKQALDVMRASKSAGYAVALAFITLDNPDLNVRRVAERVRRGGHDIPERIIRRRYESSFRRLPTAISLADDIAVFDNSELEPATLLMIEHGSIIGQSLDDGDPFHMRIAEAVAAGLRVPLAAVFMAERHE